MYDLSTFGLEQMIQSGKQLRQQALGAQTMQQGATRLIDFLYESFHFTSPPKHLAEPACALVRCFKTHPFSDLPPHLQNQARLLLHQANPLPDLRCLALLASRGEHPAWNSPHTSGGHQVIPLPTAQIVEQAPMIARLIVQMGLTVKDVVHPEPGFLIDLERQTFNVFHVEDALGSEFVPAQASFVVPYNIRSVLGFGGLLPSGELFAVVLFSKVHLSRETAALFRTLALSVKLALLPLSGSPVFSDFQ